MADGALCFYQLEHQILSRPGHPGGIPEDPLSPVLGHDRGQRAARREGIILTGWARLLAHHGGRSPTTRRSSSRRVMAKASLSSTAIIRELSKAVSAYTLRTGGEQVAGVSTSGRM